MAQTLPVYDLILLLNVARDGACLTSSSRLFQSLGPRKDIALCPVLVSLKGIERSVSAFLSSPDISSLSYFKQAGKVLRDETV